MGIYYVVNNIIILLNKINENVQRKIYSFTIDIYVNYQQKKLCYNLYTLH